MITKMLTIAATAATMFAMNANALLLNAGNAAFQGVNPTNPDAADISTIVGVPGLSLLYKGEGTDEGSFAGSYTTTFGGGNETAVITYDGAPDPAIAPAANLYLLVKDGVAHVPIWYIFNLGTAGLNWNGTDALEIAQLWPEQGSISHVTIAGTPGQRVPEGGSTAILLGTALVGIGAFRRRFAKR